MKLSQFKFKLPEDRIALYPTPPTAESMERFSEMEHRSGKSEEEIQAEIEWFKKWGGRRDDCKLMVVHRKTGVIEHREAFQNIMDYFSDKDVFVFNDSRVFPARLYGNKEKTGARIEVFLLRELNPELHLWDVLVDPARKIRIGNKLYFGPDDSLVAEVIDNTTSRGRTLRFLYDGPHDEFKKTLYGLGEAPLPRFIKRRSEFEDMDNFQTVFAKNEGAVTVPMAGMHFSRQLMKRLEIMGVDLAFITMHCGLGNFREIDVEDLSKHKMDSEEMHVPQEACDLINRAKDTGHKICAVGTTVQRALETAVSTDMHVKEFNGWTNKFIFPPYEFSVADSMIGSFYQPESTMLMLTASFGGYELIMEAYNQALKNGYLFGSYGDAMLITE